MALSHGTSPDSSEKEAFLNFLMFNSKFKALHNSAVSKIHAEKAILKHKENFLRIHGEREKKIGYRGEKAKIIQLLKWEGKSNLIRSPKAKISPAAYSSSFK